MQHASVISMQVVKFVQIAAVGVSACAFRFPEKIDKLLTLESPVTRRLAHLRAEAGWPPDLPFISFFISKM